MLKKTSSPVSHSTRTDSVTECLYIILLRKTLIKAIRTEAKKSTLHGEYGESIKKNKTVIPDYE